MAEDRTRQTYRQLNEREQALVSAIKSNGEELLSLLRQEPPKREFMIAITKTEEAVMWAVKGITA